MSVPDRIVCACTCTHTSELAAIWEKESCRWEKESCRYELFVCVCVTHMPLNWRQFGGKSHVDTRTPKVGAKTRASFGTFVSFGKGMRGGNRMPSSVHVETSERDRYIHNQK